MRTLSFVIKKRYEIGKNNTYEDIFKNRGYRFSDNR